MTRASPPARLPHLILALGLASAAAPALADPPESSTVLSSYGEINWNRPTHDAAAATADLRRIVIGLAHRFDQNMKFVSELEIEHAVSSASDSGEVEIEQAYVERQLSQAWAVRAGLILMPIGLLNQNHEPIYYYGVERNLVETAIIPTTWREGGLELVGTFENGLTLQTGLTTGFDINKWDATATEGQESPLASVHQELQQARAHDVGVHAALDWRGVPGLQLGAAFFAGGASQGQPGVPRATVAIWDVHARWTPGKLDLAALYARGTISNTGALNAPLAGAPTLIPAAFDGWYAQAAYHVWAHDGLALTPFARVEQFNTGRTFALDGAPAPAGLPTETVLTAGLNFNLSPEVVLKADVQRFDEDSSRSRVDLGLGWAF